MITPPPDSPPDSPPTPPPRRRRLRVSLRGLMILVLVIGVPLGWVAHRIRTQRQAIAAVRAAGGHISFDYQAVNFMYRTGPQRPSRTEPAAPRWLRRWLGDELFQHVEMVYFNNPVSPSILTTIAQFDRLESFSLSQSAGDGDGSLHLQGLSGLTNLSLSGAWINDAILSEIARMPALRSLTLFKSAATDAGFARLAALPELRRLQIFQATHLTDAGMAQLLAGMPKLENLSLFGQGPESLTATLAALVRHHPNLGRLSLECSGVEDFDLAMIGRLTQLHDLSLRGRFTSVGLAHLQPLNRLTRLIVSNPGVDDAGVDDAGAQHLASLIALEEVFLTDCRLTDAGLASLATLPKLTRLVLATAPAITDAGMTSIGRMTRLEDLQVTGAPDLTDAGLLPLRGLSRLRVLELPASVVTPGAVSALRQAVPTLKRVTFQ